MSVDFRKAGSVEKRALLNSPFWLADSSATWLSLPVTPVDLPSRWSFRESERKSHCSPLQAQRLSCDSRLAVAFSTAAQPRGSCKRMARHALASSLFTRSKILSQRDNNCLPRKKPHSQGRGLMDQWLAPDQQIPFSSILQLSKSCFEAYWQSASTLFCYLRPDFALSLPLPLHFQATCILAGKFCKNLIFNFFQNTFKDKGLWFWNKPCPDSLLTRSLIKIRPMITAAVW